MLGPTVISLGKRNWGMSIVTLGVVGVGIGASMYLFLYSTVDFYSAPVWLGIVAAWILAISEKSNDLWLCAECNTQNDSKHEKCKKCGAPNLKAEWVCEACVTKNSVEDTVCKRCGKPRPGTAVPEPKEREESLTVKADLEATRPNQQDLEATVPSAPVQPVRHTLWIRLESGPLAGKQFRCDAGTAVVLGRNPAKSNLLLSQYNVVSGAHCKIEVRDGKILATDLQSTNGTFFNGRRLPAGQTVSLGSQTMIHLGSGECAVSIRVE